MKNVSIKSIVCLILLLPVLSISCNTGSTVTELPLPTNTAVPTNTPLPTPTKTAPPPTPTNTPLPPTPTSTPDSGSSIVILETYPPNCFVSMIPGYMSCTDMNGAIQFDIPDTWSEIQSGPWKHEGAIIGKAIQAAPDLASFYASFSAEGVFFGATDLIALLGGYVQSLDLFTDIYSNDCVFVGRYDFSRGIYRGKYDFYQNCGGAGGYDAYMLSAVDSEDQFSMIILIYMQVMPGDTDTRDKIWDTFTVMGLLRDN